MSELNNHDAQKEVIHQGKWLSFCEVSYDDIADPNNPVRRKYECFDRIHSTKQPVDGVDVIAILKEKEQAEVQVILIEQYRPAVDAVCIEFPAGLVEKDEDPIIAALRELEEETGWVADKKDIISVSPLIHADPSITSDSTKTIMVKIDCLDQRNSNERRTQRLDPDEHITARIVPLSSLLNSCSEFVERGFVVDCKVYQFALGMNFLKSLQIPQ